MVKITVSDELIGEIGRVGGVAELCDRSGRTLGHFVPVATQGGSRAEDDCPYSEDELARMRSETGGRPLGEIWERLGRQS